MTLRHPPLRYRTHTHDGPVPGVRGLAAGAAIGALIWIIFLIGWWLS